MIHRQLLGISLLLLANTCAFASITPGIDGHTRGDIISVKTDEQIAAWCDFSKQIAITQTSVLCVYNGSTKGGPSSPVIEATPVS
ncbi:MAG: hypothetical protein P4M12_06275 [Gammaproteobacteria bacterium]|nr:hypothetical protein [Gammaproteobacteria bacterium]